MSASEFAFLALGLVLGVASGAALVEILRARPPAPREVRVTVAPDSVPRRAVTLATSPFVVGTEGPARGGPGDRRALERPVGAGGGDTELAPALAAWAGSADGTSVLASAHGAAPTATLEPLPSTLRSHSPARAAARTAIQATFARSREVVGIAIEPEPDPMFVALRAAEARAVHVLGQSDGPETTGSSVAAPVTVTAPATAAAASACGEQRHLVEERCAMAASAREGAAHAADALRDVQREYDRHREAAERAASIADPRTVWDTKEAARSAFRAARDRARIAPDVEAAASAWLAEINRINADARLAAGTATREREAERALLPTIERLSLALDAARISAESAEAACLAARQSLAECEEARAPDAPRFPRDHSAEPGPPQDLEAPLVPAGGRDEPGLAGLDGPAGAAVVIRILRGERAALVRLVAALGGDDAIERRRWQTAMGSLVDAIVGRAIEAAAFDFPTDHSFWGMFSRAEAREVAAALASLGYRFDGLAGFADERIPSQRDLSLAVGYAGLDPMRIRHWPTEEEMTELFARVTVTADEYLAGAAGGLTLGEVVTILGSRADGLTEIWNAWGRIRPLLLATS